MSKLALKMCRKTKDDLAEDNSALRAKLASARKALEPFATSPYATVAGDWDDSEICKGIKISDLRKAYDVFKEISK